MKDITAFIKNELRPRYFGNIPQIFPSMGFKMRGGKWISQLHADGTEGTGRKDDRSVVTERYPHKIFDNTRQHPTDLIDAFMQINGITERWEAVNRLCDIVGIARPEYTEESKERFMKIEQRRKALEASAERQKEALFAPEGKAVLDYLHSRGWTDSEIREAELGYISKAEATSINAQGSVGDFYTLSIPLRSGSTMYGFKFRTIQKESNGRDKYTFLSGTEKEGNLFNLTGVQQKSGAMVVVEGELDALQAQVRGISGVVATGGGALTEDLLTQAVGRGIKRITLLFDRDEAGEKYVRDSIDLAYKKGISVLVATFPEGEIQDNGKKKNDVGEYLKKHTSEDLQRLIDRASSGSIYLLDYYVDSALKEHEGSGLTDSMEIDLRNKVVDLANRTPSEIERERILKTYVGYMEANGKQAFSYDALKAEADRARGTGEAKDLGEIAKDEEKTEEYKRVFAPLNPDEFAKFMSETREGIPTGYVFTQGRQTEPLTLNPGLTFICGYRGHGKTSFLNNIALHDAYRNLYLQNGRSVLYFSYEVDKRRLIADLLNTYVDDPELSRNPTETILSYFRLGNGQYFDSGTKKEKDSKGRYIPTGETHYQHFLRKKDAFIRDYLSSGALTIVDESYKVEQLLEAIRYYLSTRKVSIVCIDYAQLIYSETYSRQRTEEIKKIVNDIKDFANKEGIPFVMAAQFNRDVNSPVGVDTQAIGEGGDYERIADTCIGLFNLKELRPTLKEAEDKAVKDLLFKLDVYTYEKGGVLSPIQDKLFVRLMKRRYGYFPIDTILDWEGRTKKITMNKPEDLLKTEQGEIFQKEETPQEETGQETKSPETSMEEYNKDLPF